MIVIEEIKEINIEELKPFKDYPFKVLNDDELLKIMQSIKENGVLIPLIAREKYGVLEIISGHRRKLACELLGTETVPVVIKTMSDDEAIIAVVDSNMQRENILPSEKAFAYKMKIEAMKRSVGRPRNNSCQVGTNYRTDEELAQNAEESARQIQRYIRLTNLIPPLLDMVDKKQIALTPAVEISYLTDEEQGYLLEGVKLNDCTPSLSQAQRLKRLSAENRLTSSVVVAILEEKKANQKEQIKLKKDDIGKYFPKSYTDEQMKKDIIKGLELLKKQRERNRDNR